MRIMNIMKKYSIWFWLGHDKMILCLAGTRASIFNTLRQAFLTKSVREAFIVVICKFLPTIIFGSFLSDSLSFFNT